MGVRRDGRCHRGARLSLRLPELSCFAMSCFELLSSLQIERCCAVFLANAECSVYLGMGGVMIKMLLQLWMGGKRHLTLHDLLWPFVLGG